MIVVVIDVVSIVVYTVTFDICGIVCVMIKDLVLIRKVTAKMVSIIIILIIVIVDTFIVIVIVDD